ncbi:AAA family ATPase [Kitasatospora misakiensis]|uniref:AAA family ATPase n=1 Tax=Kitasatospora misakiensis TaxID=67330 RepID=A0ABW0X370_9ACTN
MGEQGAAGGAGVGLPRGLVVRRLVERQAAGELTSRHVRAVADTVGVSVRTVWRWLATAKATGEVDGAPARRGFAVSDETWALLAEVGGNVAQLRRRMVEAAGDGVDVPSLGTLHRVVRRDRQLGRVLLVERTPGLVEPLRPDPLSELGLNTVAAQGAGGQVFLREQTHLAKVPVLVPGAQVVVTPSVASVVQRVAHAAAVGAVACLYGDAGHGKTVALQYALSQLPNPVRVRRVHVGVHPSVPELRRVLAEALELKRLPHGTGAADLVLLDALRQPRVLVLDEAQRLPAAALEFLRQLWDHPDTDVALLFAGAGAERALRKVPALASRVLTWELVPRLAQSEVRPVMEAFHPLWGQATPKDMAWVDEHVGHGNFRTWAKVTSHLTAEVYGQARAVVDRPLLERVCARLTGPL